MEVHELVPKQLLLAIDIRRPSYIYALSRRWQLWHWPLRMRSNVFAAAGRQAVREMPKLESRVDRVEALFSCLLSNCTRSTDVDLFGEVAWSSRLVLRIAEERESNWPLVLSPKIPLNHRLSKSGNNTTVSKWTGPSPRPIRGHSRRPPLRFT